jgi:hypothetical protein
VTEPAIIGIRKHHGRHPTVTFYADCSIIRIDRRGVRSAQCAAHAQGRTIMPKLCMVRALEAAALAVVLLAGTPAEAQINVLTHHNNSLRTGWNSSETTLTPAVVSGGTFGLLHQVVLDAQVDAQPLLVTGLTVNGAAHDVVYVATEGNSVYAIDASSGAILLHTNLGTPVANTYLPGKCSLQGKSLGIASTPVIDAGLKTLFVVAFVYSGSAQQYVLHALSLTTLADRVTPVEVSASHTLSNGKTVYDFTPGSSHQRSALLETKGDIYAAFGSFCDLNGNLSRGWLMGWHASTLAPLGQATLTNQVLPGNSPNDFFLTSIWMSGNGPAADSTGSDVFFVTGNADPSGTTYDNESGINLSESVVEVPATLAGVADYFSPTDAGADVAILDEHDRDFGAGGVMLLPDQPGSIPKLAVAAGKVGTLYLLNRASLGGENSGNALGEYSIGRCWCISSYFTGADGAGRVITSGGSSVMAWKVQTSPVTALIADPAFNSPTIVTGQSPGFFTSITSNGTTADSAVIWAIGRPPKATKEPGTILGDVTLYAFNAASGAQLYSDAAGTWVKGGGDANLVPTVANGKVYVASYQNLSIFGVSDPDHPLIPSAKFVRPAPPADIIDSAHRVSGFVRSVSGAQVIIELRDGRRVTADISDARRHHTAVRPLLGEAVFVRGDYRHGMLQAESVVRAKPDSDFWQPDR